MVIHVDTALSFPSAYDAVWAIALRLIGKDEGKGYLPVIERLSSSVSRRLYN